MRYSLIAICLLFSLVSPTFAAENPPRDVKGLYLLTDYPAVSVRPGNTSNINLRLQNYALAPERLSLKVEGVPSGQVFEPCGHFSLQGVHTRRQRRLLIQRVRLISRAAA